MARPEKVERVDEVRALFEDTRSVVLSDFTGLDVKKISELRALCRKNNIEFKVVKNTLAKLGIKDTDAAGLSEFFEGPTALAISREAENTPAKILAEFAKEHESPKFKAGFVNGNVIDATAVLALSKVPSKDELLSKLMGSLMSPGNGLVSCLQGPLRNLMNVLDQLKEQKES